MRIHSRLLTRTIIWFAIRLIRVLFWTCRKQMTTDSPNLNSYEGYDSVGEQRYLNCVWHDQILMTLFSGRPLNMAGLVSRHQDGGFVADTMEMLGIHPIRGSTRKGGAQAMRQLLDTARGFHVAITPDGPRGPRHELKMGIVFLSSYSGRGIVPIAYVCKECWKIQGNWTDMMIPKPFTKIVVRGGSPIYVPPNSSRQELEHYTARLQREMDRLEIDADRIVRGEPMPLKAAA